MTKKQRRKSFKNMKSLFKNDISNRIKYFILSKLIIIFSRKKLLIYRSTTKVKNNPLGSFEWIENLDFIEREKLPPFKVSKLLPCKFGQFTQLYIFNKDKSYTLNNETLAVDRYKIKLAEINMAKKPIIIKDEKVALLNYSSNHFGHFIAESFGSIIYFCRINSTLFKKNKVKFTTLFPSKPWVEFLKKITNYDNFEMIEQENIYKQNQVFYNSFLFQNLSRFQNILVGRNATLSYLAKFDNQEFKEKKYFLSSGISSSRIENI